MITFGRWAVASLLFSAMASVAPAQIISYTIQGAISRIDQNGTPGSWTADIDVGTPFEMIFRLDRGAVPLFIDRRSAFAIYRVASGEATVGATHFTFDDQAQFTTANGLGSHAFFFGENLSGGLIFNLSLSGSANGISDLSPPTMIDPLFQYNVVKVWEIMELTPTSRWTAEGAFDTVTVSTNSGTPVPEPSAYGTCAAGMILLVALRRRYNHRA
jgi:hypothetical protein